MHSDSSLTLVLCKLCTYTHTRLTALCPGLPGWTCTRKVKPIWILQKQKTVSGSGISWDICKSATLSRQITMPAPHHSVFYRPDALPAAQPTASKHWRQKIVYLLTYYLHHTWTTSSGLPAHTCITLASLPLKSDILQTHLCLTAEAGLQYAGP